MTEKYQVANALTNRIGRILSLKPLLRELAKAARELAESERSIVLIADSENQSLSVAAVAADDASSSKGSFSTYNQDNAAIKAWLAGQPYAGASGVLTPDSGLGSLGLNIDGFYSLPLHNDDTLAAIILVDNPLSHAPIASDNREIIDCIQTSAEIALANAQLYSRTVTELDAQMTEVEMMRQIDRELSDTISLERVFEMTLDWALRYTLAQGASLSLYNDADDELRFVADLGYNIDMNQTLVFGANEGGIPQRVARSGHAELIPDVTLDNDYVAILNTIHSHMSVPVMREDRVIAVITVEGRRVNAFTDEHLNFVAKMATRAGVAIDNARLYSEAVREQDKLSHIVSEIADIVIVINYDDRLLLINESAIAALRLSPDETYIGRPFSEALDSTPLMPVLKRALSSGQIMVEEVEINNDRVYYAELTPHPDIGWMIVMHDITPLKQTDELKRELVATVSHDLKQPLSVMNGYLELLQMTQKLDPRSENFVRMIARSIEHMRHLIDDVLDLAKIESGIELKIQAVEVAALLSECIEGVKPLADSKSMQLEVDINTMLPSLAGDPGCLQQIFNNLVGNAVKYTPAKGLVRVSVENLDRNLRFTVADNGMGISPEDQAHIFDRFYRVRRPETENIEGTGLGLAIVKKLIEAHKGQIGLESSLGKGTTFYVTLPVYSFEPPSPSAPVLQRA